MVIKIAMLILFSAGISALEAIPLWKRKYIKELVVFIAFMAAGTIFFAVYLSGIHIPSPMNPLTNFFKPLYKPITTWVMGEPE